MAWVLGIDENVIEVNNDKNIEFFGQDLVNISLEAGWCVKQPKRHDLVLEMAVSSPKSCFPFIALFYPYSIIITCEIKLGKSFCST